MLVIVGAQQCSAARESMSTTRPAIAASFAFPSDFNGTGFIRWDNALYYFEHFQPFMGEHRIEVPPSSDEHNPTHRDFDLVYDSLSFRHRPYDHRREEDRQHPSRLSMAGTYDFTCDRNGKVETIYKNFASGSRLLEYFPNGFRFEGFLPLNLGQYAPGDVYVSSRGVRFF